MSVQLGVHLSIRYSFIILLFLRELQVGIQFRVGGRCFRALATDVYLKDASSPGKPQKIVQVKGRI